MLEIDSYSNTVEVKILNKKKQHFQSNDNIPFIKILPNWLVIMSDIKRSNSSWPYIDGISDLISNIDRCLQWAKVCFVRILFHEDIYLTFVRWFDVISGEWLVVDFKLKSNGAFSSSSTTVSLIKWCGCSFDRLRCFLLPKYSCRLRQNKHSWSALKSTGTCSSTKSKCQSVGIKFCFASPSLSWNTYTSNSKWFFDIVSNPEKKNKHVICSLVEVFFVTNL